MRSSQWWVHHVCVYLYVKSLNLPSWRWLWRVRRGAAAATTCRHERVLFCRLQRKRCLDLERKWSFEDLVRSSKQEELYISVRFVFLSSPKVVSLISVCVCIWFHCLFFSILCFSFPFQTLFFLLLPPFAMSLLPRILPHLSIEMTLRIGKADSIRFGKNQNQKKKSRCVWPTLHEKKK